MDKERQAHFWEVQMHAERVIFSLIWLNRYPEEMLSQVRPEWFMSPFAKRVYEKTAKVLGSGESLSCVKAHAELDPADWNFIFSNTEQPGLAEFNSAVQVAAENYTKDTIRLLILDFEKTRDMANIEKIRLTAIENQVVMKKAAKLEDTAHDVIRHFKEGRGKDSYLSGFKSLDEATLGFRPRELYTFGGRPGEGKTSWFCQMALNLAQGETKVLFISAEMSKDDIVAYKILPVYCDIAVSEFRTSAIQSHLPVLESRYSDLSKKQIWIYDHASPSLQDIKMAAGAVGPQIMLIDYLQILEGPKSESRRIEVERLVTGIKTLAKNLKIPILLLAQLSRETDKRLGPPVMADLTESGAIERVSDMVALIWERKPRNETERRAQNDSSRKIIEVKIAKNRHGLRKRFSIELDKKTTAMREHNEGAAEEAAEDLEFQTL